jgi:hypothetical protein
MINDPAKQLDQHDFEQPIRQQTLNDFSIDQSSFIGGLARACSVDLAALTK